jgi:hypothetical protein
LTAPYFHLVAKGRLHSRRLHSRLLDHPRGKVHNQNATSVLIGRLRETVNENHFHKSNAEPDFEKITLGSADLNKGRPLSVKSNQAILPES